VYCVEGYGFCWGTCHMHSLYQNGKQAGRLLPHNSALRSPPSAVQIRTAHVAITGYLSSSGSLTTQAFSFPHSLKAILVQDLELGLEQLRRNIFHGLY